MLPETCLKAFRRLGQQGVDDAAIDIHDIVADPVFLEPLIDDFTGSRPGGGQVCACCELSTGEADAKSEAFHGCGMASGPTHFRHKKRRGTSCGSNGRLVLAQSPRRTPIILYGTCPSYQPYAKCSLDDLQLSCDQT